MDPRPRQLVLALLLGAGGAPLAARDAVRSCALFAIPERAVRVALARLAAAETIAPVQRGAYRLGAGAAGLAADMAGWRDAKRRTHDWAGNWIAVHAGALGRSDRAALRKRTRALGLLGMRELDRGLYVRPDNLLGGVAGVRGRLAGLGLATEVGVFGARDFDAERERRARALWDGKALVRGYRSTRARLERWLAGADRLGLEAAARESFRLGNDAIRQLVFDPLLPPPLVDEDARSAFIDAVVRFDAAGQAIWKAFLRNGPATGRRRVSPMPARARREKTR